MSFYKFSTTIFTNQFLPSTKRTLKHIAWVRALLSPVQWIRDTFFGYYADGYTGQAAVTYNSASTYAVGDMVFYNGIIYICISGSTGNLPTNATYFSVKNFSFEDELRHADKGVYYCIKDNPNGVAPVDQEYWERLQSNFIGVNDRIRLNAQVLSFEYLLNQWFGTNFNYPTSTNDVYITHNTVDINSFIYGTTVATSSAHFLTDATQQEFINSDYSSDQYNYNINIPTAIYDGLNPDEPTGITTTKTAIVKNFADKYNLAGITYTVLIY